MNIGKERIVIYLKFYISVCLPLGKEVFEMELQMKVKEHLLSNGIKKKHLASLLGIYPTQLSQWLSGNYTLNNSQIKRIEDFLSGK